MRNQRGKQYDWSKPFKVVSQKKQFDIIDTSQIEPTQASNGQQIKKSTHQDKKQQIIVPKIQTVKRITQIKKFSGVPINYIRINNQLNLPKLYYYQLTEVDHIFVNAHQGKFRFNGKNILNIQFLQKSFIQLQTKAGKDPVLPKAKTWMINFIERQFKQYTKMDNYQDLAQIVYNYWRNRRQQLKFPLLRPLWKPNQDQYNHLLAFKTRQKEKRNLRRANRITDQQITIQMAQQFENSLKMIQRIQLRQQLKLKAIKLQCFTFHNQCKQFKDKQQLHSIIGDIRKQQWYDSMNNDKQSIKNFQNDLENFKKRKQANQQQQQYGQPINNIFDQKLSVVNFISTVISYAQNFNINYQTLFQTHIQKPQPKPSVIGSSRINITNQIPILPIQQQHPIIDKNELVNIDLNFYNGMIYRQLVTSQQQNYQHVHSYANFFDMRKKNVCSYYFGQDDQGDYKDLKKTISTSFKKFIQINKSLD